MNSKKIGILTRFVHNSLRLVRARRGATGSCRRFNTAACVSLEIYLPQVLKRYLIHLDLEVLQRSKLAGICGTLNDTKSNPHQSERLPSQENIAREIEGCS